jgi:hypothetical protein
MATWYDEATGGRPSHQDRAAESINRGLDTISRHVEPIQRRNEERDYQQKMVGEERAFQANQATKSAAIKESQGNRPVGQPVNALLNILSGKIRERKLSGTMAAKLYKLVQTGQLSEEDAQAFLEQGSSSDPQSAMPADEQQRGPPPPSFNGAPPLPTQTEVVLPQNAQSLAAGTPMPNQQARPGIGSSQPPPMPPPPPGMVQKPVAPPIEQMGPPPPVNYQWTERDLSRSELDYLLDLYKEQGRNARTEATTSSRETVADKRVNQDQRKLETQKAKWDKDREQQWGIAMARLDQALHVSGSKGSTARDVQLLKDARAALQNLRNNDSKLRTSLPALAKDPGVAAELQANEQRIKDAEAKIKEAETRVKARMGEGTSKTPIQGEDVSFTMSERKPAAAPVPAPSAKSYVDKLRGR